MANELRLHARTDVGCARDHNEDNFLYDPSLGLFAVADGMGGHAAGEVASQLAVHALATAVARDRDFLHDFARNAVDARVADVKNLLAAAVTAANTEVYASGQAVAERRGMGTTLSVLLVLGARAFVAHVGDSRIYLLRGGEVRQITEDHSVLNELRRRGRLRPEELAKIKVKNAITRAIGVFETVEVDSGNLLCAPGDRFVLCSDGLHQYLESEDELAKLVDNVSEEAATQRLIDVARERGGSDNITAIVVTLPDEAARTEVVRELSRSYNTLSALPFFRNLEPRELLQVQAIAHVRDCAAGAVVVREGTAGESMFVVLSGGCAVRKGDVDLARVVPGEHFGEMGLVTNAPRSASVVAEEPSRMLEIQRADLFRLLLESKDTGLKLLWNIILVLVGRLRATSEQLGEAREALRSEDLTTEILPEDLLSLMPEPIARGSAAVGTRDTLPGFAGDHTPIHPRLPPTSSSGG